jgi:hypothetical protein
MRQIPPFLSLRGRRGDRFFQLGLYKNMLDHIGHLFSDFSSEIPERVFRASFYEDDMSPFLLKLRGAFTNKLQNAFISYAGGRRGCVIK